MPLSSGPAFSALKKTPPKSTAYGSRRSATVRWTTSPLPPRMRDAPSNEKVTSRVPSDAARAAVAAAPAAGKPSGASAAGAGAGAREQRRVVGAVRVHPGRRRPRRRGGGVVVREIVDADADAGAVENGDGDGRGRSGEEDGPRPTTKNKNKTPTKPSLAAAAPSLTTRGRSARDGREDDPGETVDGETVEVADAKAKHVAVAAPPRRDARVAEPEPPPR